MALAVVLPTATASVSIFFIRASGLKGLPLTIPIEAISPMRADAHILLKFIVVPLVANVL